MCRSDPLAVEHDPAVKRQLLQRPARDLLEVGASSSTAAVKLLKSFWSET